MVFYLNFYRILSFYPVINLMLFDVYLSILILGPVQALSTSGVLFFLVQFTGISALVMFMVNIFQVRNFLTHPNKTIHLLVFVRKQY